MQTYTYKECLPYLNQNRVMEEGEEDDTMFIDILRKYFDDKEEKAVKEAVEDTTKSTTYELIKEMLRKNIDEKTVIEVTKITDQELKEIKAAMC